MPMVRLFVVITVFFSHKGPKKILSSREFETPDREKHFCRYVSFFECQKSYHFRMLDLIREFSRYGSITKENSSCSAYYFFLGRREDRESILPNFHFSGFPIFDIKLESL